MYSTLRGLVVVVLLLTLNACAGALDSQSFQGCNVAGDVCVDGVRAGAKSDGKVVTAWRLDFIDPDTGQMTHSVQQETADPVRDKAAVAIAGTLPQAIVHGISGVAIAGIKAGGGGQAGSLAAASAQTLVSVTSDTDVGVTVGQCPSGSCFD